MVPKQIEPNRPRANGVVLPDAAWRKSLRKAALHWFASHARDLAWRRSRDPYRVWISEIMLQQTQAQTVGPYFERFVHRFPTIQQLAAADEQDVLRLWEGLGYYRRARQLHQAASVIVAMHGGQFPRELADVLQLPGIGRYTAGAILSIAHDQRQPILEANTIRLYSRLLGYRGDPRRAAGQRVLWEFAEAILPRKGSGTLNQAMMELGSEVCRPRMPDCAHCPLAALCPTRANGWQDQIPMAGPATQYESIEETAVVVWNGPHVLLRRCGPRERWAGMWDFPRFAATWESTSADGCAEAIRQQTGVRVALGPLLTVFKHGVTRFRITLRCYQAQYRSGRLTDDENHRWVIPTALSEYPLSVTGRKLSRWVSGS